jgi:hypothetical protein
MWHRFPVGLRTGLGIELAPVSHAERLISGVGGFVGIFGILAASHATLGDLDASLLIVGSMGASAVLVFGVPHGPLSQPWAVAGGHAVSAFIGVCFAKLVPQPFVAAALAVGVAIGAMHYLRCVHPPGGATAITPVIAGPAVHALGFRFLLTPVLLNVAILLAAAIAVNACVSWRRYPAGRGGRVASAAEAREVEQRITEHELARIHRLAVEHERTTHLEPRDVRRHRFYSNGHYGAEWSIRRVLDDSPHDDDSRDLVTWRAVDGKGRGEVATCPRSEFARWARHEVFRDAAAWRRREA